MMEENKDSRKNKKNGQTKKDNARVKEDDQASTSASERHTRRSRQSYGSSELTFTGDLMSEALAQTVSDNIIAGPHGALHTVGPVAPERWSFVSTHTLLMKRRSNDVDDPVDFETAVTETGHGCFQYKLMAICGFIYACCSLSTTTLSFVLPAAQYDFNLDSVKKGVLNTAPLWGMVAGAYIWGNFADNKGRRFVLMWTLLIDSIASFASSFCQGFELFYAFRIFNGFAIIGSTSIIFAYMGEFLDHAHRDTFLTRLELFWTFGIISLPLIGLAILPQQISWGDRDTFIYNSWRVFVFTCGLPSLTASILIFRMPESPRFLLIQGKLDETRQVLERMFVSNTGKPKEEFSVKVLSESPEADSYYFQRVRNISFGQRIKNLLKGIYKQHRDLFRGRSRFNIIITCFVDFGLIAVYYTMMLWVPELLNREEQWILDNPNATQLATLCQTAEVKSNHEQDSEINVGGLITTDCLSFITFTNTVHFSFHMQLNEGQKQKKYSYDINVAVAIKCYGCANCR